MRALKHKLDAYFELDGDIEGQLWYYGCVGSMILMFVCGVIADLASK